MRFLLDENISPLLVEKIKILYPGSMDIYDIDFAGKSDREIYTIFRDRQNYPP
ncbi:MAG: hypothetical protein GY950_03575 [bacterium]|nr:hypothetical protein [bacterium]